MGNPRLVAHQELTRNRVAALLFQCRIVTDEGVFLSGTGINNGEHALTCCRKSCNVIDFGSVILFESEVTCYLSVDFFRLDANRKLDPSRRSDLGQFMTPPPTARLMASLFQAEIENIRLLDAGAGVGSLTAAFVGEICNREQKPKEIHVTAYEVDGDLAEYLANTLKQCGTACRDAGIAFEADLISRDVMHCEIAILPG